MGRLAKLAGLFQAADAPASADGQTPVDPRNSKAPLVERRAEPRSPCPAAKVMCRFARGRVIDAWWSPIIRDISAGGIGLLQDRCVAVGTHLSMELTCPECLFSRRRVARVHHVTPHLNGWLIGCKLLRRLAPEELRVLLICATAKPLVLRS